MCCASARGYGGVRGHRDSLSRQTIKHMCCSFPVCLPVLTVDKLRSFLSRSPDSNDISQYGHTTSVSPLRCVQNARFQIIELISAFGLLLFEAAKLVELEVDFILGLQVTCHLDQGRSYGPPRLTAYPPSQIHGNTFSLTITF